MDNKPLVSIIIPFYNAEKYLKRCIDSVTGQDYASLEVLAVDDGSEDGSAGVVRECAEKDGRIRLISAGHGGASEARNRGVREAKGSLVTFVDSDDWIGPHVIGHMVEAMLETGADVADCAIKHRARPEEAWQEFSMQDSGPGYTVYTGEEYRRFFFRIGGNRYVHYAAAKLYKKTLLSDPLFPAGIRIGEDVLGTYRAIRNAGKIVSLNETGYFYFEAPMSATSLFTEKDFDLLKVWDMMTEETEGSEPDHTYAVIGRKRINFTLVFRLLTEVPSVERKDKYKEQTEQLRKALKACERDLYRAPIVRSRKILIFLISHLYPVMSLAGGVLVRLKGAGR